MARRRLVVTTGMGLLAACGLMVAGASDLRPLLKSQAVQLVEQLRTLPTPLPPAPRSDGRIDPVEERRHEVYRQLRELRGDAVAALATALGDADVSMRRNVALALNVLAGTWFEPSQPRLDIRACLPALMAALEDSDNDVRAWAAQAIGETGADGAQAVPALIRLLTNLDEGSRNNACMALGGIGPGAKEALPALRRALTDSSADVRRSAQRAIDRIEGRQKGPTV
jgi:HEAT repeat protein